MKSRTRGFLLLFLVAFVVWHGIEGCDQPMYTALEEAALRGHVGMVELLIEAGADVNLEGHSPLLLATRSGHENVVRLLLDAGADPNVRNHCGHSALDYALAGGYDAIVDLLSEAGAFIRFPWRNMPEVF